MQLSKETSLFKKDSIKDDIDYAKGHADNYMSFDSTNGLTVASTNPSSATRKVQITNTGIKVQNDATHYTQIDSNGMQVFSGDASNSVASFGTTARVGKEDAGHINTTGDSIELYYGNLKLGTFQKYGTSNAGLLRLIGGNSTGQVTPNSISFADQDTSSIYTSTSIRLLSSSDDRNVKLSIVGDGHGGHLRELYITAPDGVDISNNLVVIGTIKSSGGLVPTRNQMCYANSRVDNFVGGQITLPLSSLGITTGAKPVGILLTYQDGGATPTILRYDYDASSASGVVIKAYNSSGGAVSGNIRYFALVFQNSWTSVV